MKISYLLPGVPIPNGEEFTKLPKQERDRWIKEVLSIKYLRIFEDIAEKNP